MKEKNRKQLKEVWLAIDSEGRIYDIRLTRGELAKEVESWSWCPIILNVNVELNLRPKIEDLFI